MDYMMRMAFLQLWRSAMRGVAALLLLLVVATPALAEIGCAGESVEHVQTNPADDHETVGSEDRSDGDQTGAPQGHCAFNHGHCAAIPTSGKEAAAMLRPVLAYRPSTAAPLIASLVDTPERPPAA